MKKEKTIKPKKIKAPGEKNVFKELLLYIPLGMICFSVGVILLIPSNNSSAIGTKIEYKSLDKNQYIFEGNKLGDTNLEYNYSVSDQDLKKLQAQNEYQPGKSNPFSNEQTNNGGSNSNNNNNNNNNGNSNNGNGNTDEPGNGTKDGATGNASTNPVDSNVK